MSFAESNAIESRDCDRNWTFRVTNGCSVAWFIFNASRWTPVASRETAIFCKFYILTLESATEHGNDEKLLHCYHFVQENRARVILGLISKLWSFHFESPLFVLFSSSSKIFLHLRALLFSANCKNSNINIDKFLSWF